MAEKKLNDEQEIETQHLEKTQKSKRQQQDVKLADNVVKASVVGVTADVVSRYGAANKEYLVAYSGVDNATGQTRHQSLKSIAQSKVNPDYAKQNIKQQSGYSAEVLSVADSNADSASKGKIPRRGRTDDHGSVNDQLYDTMDYDEHGNPIAGSGTQIKFVGNTPEETLSKLASKKYEKYLIGDAKLEIPSDMYDGVVEATNDKISKIEEQLRDPNVANDPQKYKAKRNELEKYRKIKQNLRKSSVSTHDAKFARKHPKLVTAKRIAKQSHEAGLKSAEYGAAIGGTVSIVQNTVQLFKGDIEPEDAICNVAKDTACAAANAYGVGFAGAAVSGAMQNAKSEYTRALAKSTLPGTMVQVAITSGKTICKFLSGKIDGVECLKELGQNGTSMISAELFSVVGGFVIPGVGAIAGAMLGYALSATFYGSLNAALQEAKIAREDRERIERECAEQIKLIKKFRAELEALINEYLSEKREIFDCAFNDMKNALAIGDIDGYISNANKITRALGGHTSFETFEEFNNLMEDSSLGIVL